MTGTFSKDTFYFKDLTITEAVNKASLPPKESLSFGATFSNHMLEVKWSAATGWGAPKIVPIHPFELHPGAKVLHYASECFEGAKAYKGPDGKPRVFRLDKNMQRLKNSVCALGLPDFDENEARKCIEELVKLEQDFIPEGNGYSLYLRPTVIGSEANVNTTASSEAIFYVVCCPCGPYFSSKFEAVRLYADTKHVRAWPGGTGGSKLGSNYAGGVVPTKLANQKGYQQILWLIGDDHQVSEAGTMNIFILWVNEQGELELITPELDGTILPGITRDSIITIAKGWGEFKVTEGRITMDQILKAEKENRLREVFGAGTACVVCPVKQIGFMDSVIDIPLEPGSEFGPVTQRIFDEVTSIQYGKKQHIWSTALE
ncbi:hypothetical protein BB560_001868 [Smittium megazygosporum]|uniref:Branched-chain-amino-acid aminotransferase n=1 Tax=Smittium megazygosporum TaxID=133381 RepID=A0A2T9ZGE4_9FUNG|nr:hypothetical protein BB560_001868 [Smittium megazygosporum]